MFSKSTISKLVGTSAFLFAALGMSSVQAAPRQVHTKRVHTKPVYQQVDVVKHDAGFYVGAAGGYGQVGEKITNATTDNDGFVYLFNAGYQFDKYIGLEAGYTGFPNIKANGVSVIKNNNIVDIAAKATIPFESGFKVFGKVGVARVTSRNLEGLLNSSGEDVSGTHTKILPYLGVGIGLPVSQNVDLELQVAGTPKSNLIPAMYAATIGLTFHF